jgi:pimeloyl-ACP methyl ester carboxylesterase
MPVSCRTGTRWRTSIRALSALGLVLLIGACAGARPAVEVPPSLIPITRDQAPVAAAASAQWGEIVRVDDRARFSPELVDTAGSIKRAVYHSTSGLTGQGTKVSGVFAVPKGDPPGGGWPVVSVGHGTTGIGHGCAPSLRADLMGYQSTVTGLLRAGFAVAMSDYEGLDDIGVHPYLEPRTAAFNVIDGARAMGHLFAGISTEWAALGGSQGGQAAWAANEFNYEYGRGLQLVGTVALAPPVNMAELADIAIRGELTESQRSWFALLVLGLERSGLLPDAAVYLRGTSAPADPRSLRCGRVSTGGKRSVPPSANLGPRDAAETTVLQHALQETALPQRPLSAPMLVINGMRDQLVPPTGVAAAVQLSCELGGDIEHLELPEAGHAGEFPYREIEKWLAQRFAGEPTEPNCR